MTVRLHRCCLDCTLKSGATFIGAVNALGGFANILVGFMTLEAPNIPVEENEELHHAFQIIKTVCIFVAILGSILLMLSGLLIYGVLKEIKLYLVLWVAYTSFYIVVFEITNVISTLVFTQTKDFLLAVYSGICATVSLPVELYFILVVYSLYCDLKQKETSRC
ncbi:hypothetical protein C0J52_08601 [Blattella germanica]|nr:hypothetical protein C0J52_08601 [Blattella germanica]